MADKQDGGRWALAGYLYQIVCMWSITARVSSLALDAGRGKTDDMDVLIDMDPGGPDDAPIEAQHEQYGEDALFRVGDKRVLAQFKYSTTSPPRKIGRPELASIIEKLDDHAKQAKELGQKITACALVTNRQFTSGQRAAKQLWEDEQKRKRSYRLRKLPKYSLNDGMEALKEFARSYGVTEKEAAPGIHRLIGQVLTQTCEQTFDASVFEQDLVEAFTGSRRARPLTIKGTAELRCQQLRRLEGHVRIDQWQESPVLRGVFDDVIRETCRRALIWLYGPGGCGKSVIVWQLMKHLQDQNRCFFVVKFARNLQASWVTDAVHEWRNLPVGKRPDDDLERSIDRLAMANPGDLRPIIWLALDGLDEGIRLPDQRAQVHRLLNQFWEMDSKVCDNHPPLATLEFIHNKSECESR